MIEATCAFTGHRPKSFPWKYDETAPGCILLKEALAVQIKALSDRGVTDFLSGMAQGTDLWCSQIVLDLKRKNPALRLHCVLPCEGQADGWPASEQERYFSILEQADKIVYVHREYHSGCMLERNRYLVDHAQFLIAVSEHAGDLPSDMTQMEAYAYQKSLGMIFIHPDTVEVKGAF